MSPMTNTLDILVVSPGFSSSFDAIPSEYHAMSGCQIRHS